MCGGLSDTGDGTRQRAVRNGFSAAPPQAGVQGVSPCFFQCLFMRPSCRSLVIRVGPELAAYPRS